MVHYFTLFTTLLIYWGGLGLAGRPRIKMWKSCVSHTQWPMWLDEAQRLLKRWEGAVLRFHLQATSFVENSILQHGSAIGHILCICFYFRGWILFYPLLFLLFFAAVKVEGCDVIPKKSLIQARRTKWGCLQLYRHSFFHMLCLNMPLMAVYIYIYMYVFFFKLLMFDSSRM